MDTKNSYRACLEALDNLVLKGQPRTVNSLSSPNLETINEYIRILSLDLSKMSFIHVAGTKGKGSTCSFCEHILRQSGYKTGLFTSPHILDVRERIRINGAPISKELFSTHFWECWKALEVSKSELFPSMATYFRFMTLLGFKVFMEEQVDVAIIEVGLGGRLDSTNVIPSPVVCGITSLGYDHMSILGNTLSQIANEKAGIIKPGVPVVTAPQNEEAMRVIIKNAKEVGADLYLAPPLSAFEEVLNQQKEHQNGTLNTQSLKLGIPGEHQQINASVALSLCQIWLERSKVTPKTTTEQLVPEIPLTQRPVINIPIDSISSVGIRLNDESQQSKQTELPNDQSLQSSSTDSVQMYVPVAPIASSFVSGLESCRWVGRSQIFHAHQFNTDFYLDGAHTDDSIRYCLRWFLKELHSNNNSDSKPSRAILVFTCTTDRDPMRLLEPIAQIAADVFDDVIFCAMGQNKPLLAPIKSNSNNNNNNSEQQQQQKTVNVEFQMSMKNIWQQLRTKYSNSNNNNNSSSSSNNSEQQQRVIVAGGVSEALDFISKANDSTGSSSSSDNAAAAAANQKVLVIGSFFLVSDVLKQLVDVCGDEQIKQFF